MNPVDLLVEGRKLEHWRSAIVARIGGANVKIERMNGEPQESETHEDFAEALMVLEGNLELECGGARHSLQPHQLFVVPQGVPHQVLPGSSGVVFIVNLLAGAVAPWLPQQAPKASGSSR
jgi:mannose-6-phosphate isomerase-like protein (cupin superfamily)